MFWSVIKRMQGLNLNCRNIIIHFGEGPKIPYFALIETFITITIEPITQAMDQL